MSGIDNYLNSIGEEFTLIKRDRFSLAVRIIRLESDLKQIKKLLDGACNDPKIFYRLYDEQGVNEAHRIAAEYK